MAVSDIAVLLPYINKVKSSNGIILVDLLAAKQNLRAHSHLNKFKQNNMQMRIWRLLWRDSSLILAGEVYIALIILDHVTAGQKAVQDVGQRSCH